MKENHSSQAHLEAIIDSATDVILTIDESSRIQFASEAIESMFGYAPATIEGEPLTMLMPERYRVQHLEAIEAYVDSKERSVDWNEVEFPGLHREGHEIPLSISFSEFVQDGERFFTGIIRDVSSREKRKQALEDLNLATRNLMHAVTPSEIYSLAVQLAADLLDVSDIAIYTHDAEQNALVPAASSPELRDLVGELPTLTQSESIAWEVYVDQDSVYFPDVREHEAVYNPETPIRSEVLVPLGDHGVFIAVNASIDAYDEADIDLIHILAANVEAALDRAEREQALREHDRTLAQRNEELTQVQHLNSIVRQTLETVVSASSRAEIEQDICDCLAAAEAYRGAWIGEYDDVTETLDPTAWEGIDNSFFDYTQDGPTTDETNNELIRRAIDTGEVQTDQDLLDEVGDSSERMGALTHGYQSLAVVPLSAAERTHSVLTILAKQPGAFTDRDLDVLSDTGALLGRAILERDRQQALVEGGWVELELSIDEPQFFYTRLADEVGSHVNLENLVHRDDSVVQFLRVEVDDAERLETLSTTMPAVESATIVTDLEDAVLCRIVTTDRMLTDRLSERSGKLTKAEATSDGTSLTVQIPFGTDIRSFIDSLDELYDGVELVARHETTQDVQAPKTLETELQKHLTERQFEALQSAFLAGYFENPRLTQGEALAEMMGVSSPTFHSHLRAAQRKLVGSVFSEVGREGGGLVS